jgi:hypothetical protein
MQKTYDKWAKRYSLLQDESGSGGGMLAKIKRQTSIDPNSRRFALCLTSSVESLIIPTSDHSVGSHDPP